MACQESDSPPTRDELVKGEKKKYRAFAAMYFGSLGIIMASVAAKLGLPGLTGALGCYGMYWSRANLRQSRQALFMLNGAMPPALEGREEPPCKPEDYGQYL